MLGLSVIALHLALSAAPATAPADNCDDTFVNHNLDVTLGCFGDDATVTLEQDPLPPETFRGKDAVREFLEVFLPGLVITPVDDRHVRVENHYLSDLGIASAGVEREVTRLGPKIQTLTWRFDPETRAKLAAAVPIANKAVVRRFYDGINAGDRSVFDSCISPNFVQHTVMNAAPGRQGLKDFYEEFWKAFPTAHFTIEDLLAEGNKVSARMTGRYVHKGPYLGIAATGKAVVLPRIAIFRIWGGRIIEHWDQADRLGLLQQLGAVEQKSAWTASPGYEGFR